MKLAALSYRAAQVRSSGGQQLSLALAISDGEAISTCTWCGTRFIVRWCNHPMVDARTHRIGGIHAYCGARAKGFALVFSPRLGLSCIVGCPLTPRQGTTICP